MNGSTQKSGDVQCASGGTFRPSYGHVVAVQTVFLNSAFAQRLIPRYGQPFGDLHLAAITRIQNMLQTGIQIDLGQVCRFHLSHYFQHFQKLAYQTLN